MRQFILTLTPCLLIAAPNPPTNLTFDKISTNAVTLNWIDNSNDETGFKIYKDNKLIAITLPNTNKYTASNLKSDTSYTFTVAATDDIVRPSELLSQNTKNSLAYMGNEERLAYDIYTTLYNFHIENGTNIKQLYNIANRSETKHITIVQDLIKNYNIDITSLSNVKNPIANMNIDIKDMPVGTYDIQAIQDLYNNLYDKGIKSQKDALEVGCMVEVIDIEDLNRYINEAKNSGAYDIVSSYETLKNGSYNHYSSFDSGLKKIGISDGCCSLGIINDINFCISE